jgi:hypothetical protein
MAATGYTLSLLVPDVAWASGPPTTFRELVNVFVGLINLLIPLIFTAIFVFMIWKLIDAWILNVGDEKKRTEGKFYVMAAILALFLAVSTWGIITLLRQSLLG